MLTDTHAHLDFDDYNADLPDVLSRAAEAGVSKIITISTTLESCKRAVNLAQRHAQVRAAVGIHPLYVDEVSDDFIGHLRKFAEHPSVCAIGETGIDYHKNQTPPETGEDRARWLRNRERQASFFKQQLDLAVESGLNVVVHQRDSWSDCLRIITPYANKLKAVFHCFGGTLEEALELTNLGFLVSFTGIVTFKNATAPQRAAANLPAGTFFLETDCPFLAPTPHRGKRCEPAYTRLTAEHIAKLRGESLESLASHTTAAADAFFTRRGRD
jgi:TatD DNase family protein